MKVETGEVRAPELRALNSFRQRAASYDYSQIMKRVVAAVIEKDGKLLVCQRTRHQTMPLKWEFPGRKN